MVKITLNIFFIVQNQCKVRFYTFKVYFYTIKNDFELLKACFRVIIKMIKII